MEKEEEFIQDLTNEEITSLFKGFLDIVREIYEDHESYQKRLVENYPELKKVIESSNCLGEEKFKQIRKRVLDMGNETIRSNARKTEKVKVLFRNK